MDERKLTKQIKDQQGSEMKACTIKQKMDYKNSKTDLKKVKYHYAILKR